MNNEETPRLLGDVFSDYIKEEKKATKDLLKKLNVIQEEVPALLTDEEYEVVLEENEEVDKSLEKLMEDLGPIDFYIRQMTLEEIHKWYQDVNKQYKTVQGKKERITALLDLRKETIEDAEKERLETKRTVESYYLVDSNIKNLCRNLDIVSNELRKKVNTIKIDETSIKKRMSEQERLLILLALFLTLNSKVGKKQVALGLALTSALIVESLRRLLNPADEMRRYLIIYQDVSREISSALDETKTINSKIDGNLNEIDRLERNFKEEYQEFLEVPAFKELLSVITSIKDTIESKKSLLAKTEAELEESLKDNNIKIKQLEAQK